ncbi:uncharacterized protein A1O9_03674 [Exophiala aquamarina CBS 119918]|uniref:Zn(2)-C6 fungal-type domain-containing protein n=1 Tax=Exophiala aquamarina CBS 119918 TaxID=1182545 RepID=A0A072PG71_9EURO|nr:uncharacterized protein A1O9_03674 [Exophiala aquamarina CBS 119918]KEF58831.1 hypothetical protein A1O9_03674 [Exophiala aquamarina CBS 119918]
MSRPGDPHSGPHLHQTPQQQSSTFTHIARLPSWNGSVEDSPTAQQQHSRKRSADHLPSEPHVARKGRACLACRKLKVKCDSLERGDAGCSRCQRLSLECVTSKRMRVSLEDDNENPHPSIVRLDRAVEDILSRLKMPSLDAYGLPGTSETRPAVAPTLLAPTSQPGTNVPDTAAQTTRENSRDPNPEGQGEHEMAPAPMGSLYEVTQLNTLRSRLKYGDPARRNSKKNMEADLIALGILTVDEAEEMLALFKTSLSRYLFDATIQDSRTLLSVRESSTLFFTAMVTVTSLHIPGKERIHEQSAKHLRELIATSFFDRFHTLEDIRALTIAAFWLPDLSWKLSGHCVRMATELNLHQAFYKALYSLRQSPSEREHAFERARLWYLLYVLDHHFSIAYGRPPVTAELQAIKEYEVFLNAPECTTSDRRVLSQVTLFIILSKAYNHFGLEAERLMEGDDATLLTHQRFIEDLDQWRYQFRHALQRDPHVGDYPAVGVELHYHFASMMLNSLALRGRSLFTISSTSTLPTSLRPLASHAISSAHQILMIVLEEPNIRDSMVGVPLYLHTVIAFAVVFLIKMSSRWMSIGVSIDPETRTKPLIEAVIALFRACKAGKAHMLYSMADGFERLLRRNLANGRPPAAVGGLGVNGLSHAQANSNAAGKLMPGLNFSQRGQTQGQAQSLQHGQPSTPDLYRHDANATLLQQQTASPPSFAHQNGANYDPFALSPHSQPTSAGTFGGWQTEDDMLWSMSMGYDLLATAPDVNAHGLSSLAGWNAPDGGGAGYGGL